MRHDGKPKREQDQDIHLSPESMHKDLCGKPKTPCSKCKNSSYAPLNERVIEDHLRGIIVAGVYPMMQDETCFFLAIDFDKEGWQKDISIVRDACKEFNIPVAVERSRSGNGGHAWFFFEIFTRTAAGD